MTLRKDYRVTVKVTNNNILKAAESAGYTSIPKLAEDAGIVYTSLNSLINMTLSPLLQSGEVRPMVERLCEFLKVPFDDLFSEQQREALDTNKTEKEMDAEQIYALTSQDCEYLQICHDDGLQKAVDDSLKILTPRELLVIRSRMGFDGPEQTFDQIGETLGVSAGRVHQLEKSALRKLRHPSNSKTLREFMQ